MDDRLGELLAERYGQPPTGEGTRDEDDKRGEGVEIARRRRVLWLGMNGEDGEE